MLSDQVIGLLGKVSDLLSDGILDGSVLSLVTVEDFGEFGVSVGHHLLDEGVESSVGFLDVRVLVLSVSILLVMGLDLGVLFVEPLPEFLLFGGFVGHGDLLHLISVLFGDGAGFGGILSVVLLDGGLLPLFDLVGLLLELLLGVLDGLGLLFSLKLVPGTVSLDLLDEGQVVLVDLLDFSRDHSLGQSVLLLVELILLGLDLSVDLLSESLDLIDLGFLLGVSIRVLLVDEVLVLLGDRSLLVLDNLAEMVFEVGDSDSNLLGLLRMVMVVLSDLVVSIGLERVDLGLPMSLESGDLAVVLVSKSFDLRIDVGVLLVDHRSLLTLDGGNP